MNFLLYFISVQLQHWHQLWNFRSWWSQVLSDNGEQLSPTYIQSLPSQICCRGFDRAGWSLKCFFCLFFFAAVWRDLWTHKEDVYKVITADAKPKRWWGSAAALVACCRRNASSSGGKSQKLCAKGEIWKCDWFLGPTQGYTSGNLSFLLRSCSGPLIGFFFWKWKQIPNFQQYTLPV